MMSVCETCGRGQGCCMANIEECSANKRADDDTGIDLVTAAAVAVGGASVATMAYCLYKESQRNDRAIAAGIEEVSADEEDREVYNRMSRSRHDRNEPSRSTDYVNATMNIVSGITQMVEGIQRTSQRNQNNANYREEDPLGNLIGSMFAAWNAHN